MCSGPETGSYLRLIDFVYHSTLGLTVIIKKKKRVRGAWHDRHVVEGCVISSGNRSDLKHHMVIFK